MEFKIPDSLKAQRAELEVELRKVAREGSRLGDVANAVTALMQLHFAKEEKYVLPLLGLLPELAQDGFTTGMAEATPLADRLKLELNGMLNDHKAIIAALTDFANAARAADKLGYVRVAEKLILHVRAEEELFYPTAILIGEYVKAKLELAGRKSGNRSS